MVTNAIVHNLLRQASHRGPEVKVELARRDSGIIEFDGDAARARDERAGKLVPALVGIWDREVETIWGSGTMGIEDETWGDEVDGSLAVVFDRFC